MKRRSGYYWVKIGNEYCIAEYSDSGLWYITGNEIAFNDDEFSWINDKEIEMIFY